MASGRASKKSKRKQTPWSVSYPPAVTGSRTPTTTCGRSAKHSGRWTALTPSEPDWDTWPRVVYTQNWGKQAVTLEVEVDETIVLHITSTDSDPAADTLQVGGLTLRIPGMTTESFLYLPDDATVRLRDALNDYINAAELEAP